MLKGRLSNPPPGQQKNAPFQRMKFRGFFNPFLVLILMRVATAVFVPEISGFSTIFPGV